MVERFLPHAGPFGKSVDLFGCIDIIAITPRGICGIQSCGNDFAGHDKKILVNEFALEWLRAGGTLELWAWRRVKYKRGGKLVVWRPRIRVYDVKDFG